MWYSELLKRQCCKLFQPLAYLFYFLPKIRLYSRTSRTYVVTESSFFPTFNDKTKKTDWEETNKHKRNQIKDNTLTKQKKDERERESNWWQQRRDNNFRGEQMVTNKTKLNARQNKDVQVMYANHVKWTRQNMNWSSHCY